MNLKKIYISLLDLNNIYLFNRIFNFNSNGLVHKIGGLLGSSWLDISKTIHYGLVRYNILRNDFNPAGLA